MDKSTNPTAHYHLPGLFEFYELYRLFLPIYREHREYFYEWCDIGSIYGSPADCLWGGGRVGFGDADAIDVYKLMKDYEISARLTFSNSLLKEEHLCDRRCNELCKLFNSDQNSKNGVIVVSEILIDYLKKKYPELYLVSSTTKVITEFSKLVEEVDRTDFSYVVPDFRINNQFEQLNTLSSDQKQKLEFLCNECCWIGCKDRRICYENVSHKNLGDNCIEHICKAPDGDKGYSFSRAMENPAFIGIDKIKNNYLPAGFNNFKIEGRSLGSAMVLEFLLYYMTKPEYQLKVRELIYLDSMLDLF